jgi:acetyl-CoA acyltransferase
MLKDRQEGNKMSKNVVIVAYGRSAIGRARKGGLAYTHPIDYSAQVLKGVIAQVPELNPADIEDIIVGCAMPFNETAMNVARLIVNRAELPESICGQTVNRFCASALQTIATAANAIAAGQGDVYIAGGVEDMSKTFGIYDFEKRDKWFDENYPGGYMSMGETAERVADRYKISRIEMEEMAVISHEKAGAAQRAGKLAASIIPVTATDESGNRFEFSSDDGIRATTMETLAGLKPCFRSEGRVTAATSSQTSDAAAFVMLMSEEKANALGVKPVARLVSYATEGLDATVMGLGPIYAVPKVMKRAGLAIEEMDVIEINEAFAAQAIACCKDLNFNMAIVNPYGGAIALGHPLGATGTILTCKALDYLKENHKKYALVTMCIGGGMGAAGIFERL